MLTVAKRGAHFFKVFLATETWNVKAVERKRAAKVPQTSAAVVMPDRIPNTDVLCLSKTLSAWMFLRDET
jgi:hypothetical protein